MKTSEVVSKLEQQIVQHHDQAEVLDMAINEIMRLTAENARLRNQAFTLSQGSDQ